MLRCAIIFTPCVLLGYVRLPCLSFSQPNECYAGRENTKKIDLFNSTSPEERMKPLQTSRSSRPNAGNGHRHRFGDFFVTGVFCVEVQHFNELTTTSRQVLDGIANELLLLGEDLNLLEVLRWIERLLKSFIGAGL